MHRTRAIPLKKTVYRLSEGDEINMGKLSQYDVFIMAGDSSARISIAPPGPAFDSWGFEVVNDGSLSIPIDCPGGFLGGQDSTSVGGSNTMTFECIRTEPGKWYWVTR
jgi:hypothetical protein